MPAPAEYRASLPTGMPMPPAPWSPRPRMRSPSVTTMTRTSRFGQLRRTSATWPRSWLEIGLLAAVVLHHARDLLLHGEDERGQEALQAERRPLLLRERGPLVQRRVVQEVGAAGQARLRLGLVGGRFGHGGLSSGIGTRLARGDEPTAAHRDCTNQFF